MAVELPHFGWERAEADGATPVAPVDAVDQQREPMMALLSAVGRRAVAVSRKNKRRAEDGLSHSSADQCPRREARGAPNAPG